MIGTVRPAQAGFPDCGTENDYRQEEKHANDFQPDNAAHAAKWPQEASNAAGDAPGSLAGNLARSAALSGPGSSIDNLLAGGRLAGSGLGAGGDALAGDASGDTEPDAQSAPDGLWFHPDFDGNSAASSPALRWPVALLSGGLWPCFPEIAATWRLLWSGIGSKVEESQAATRAFSLRRRPPALQVRRFP